MVTTSPILEVVFGMFIDILTCYGGFRKRATPKSSILMGVSMKQAIQLLGIPHFWKPPHMVGLSGLGAVAPQCSRPMGFRQSPSTVNLKEPELLDVGES